jgi:hypothetical protein
MGKDKEVYEDCPVEIYDLATTKWEKSVALGFLDIHKKLNDFSKDIEWLKYMIKGVFAVTVIAVVANLILKFI